MFFYFIVSHQERNTRLHYTIHNLAYHIVLPCRATKATRHQPGTGVVIQFHQATESTWWSEDWVSSVICLTVCGFPRFLKTIFPQLPLQGTATVLPQHL